MVKKILKIAGVVFIIIILLCMVWFAWARRINNKELDNHEVIYKSSSKEAKKAMIIYQKSNTSISDDIAKSIAVKLADNGYDVMVNYPGEFLSDDLSKYDLVVFGSPTYMASVSSVLQNYIKRVTDCGNAKLLFYSVGMLDSTEELDSVDELFPNIRLEGKFKVVQSEFKENENTAWKKLEEYI